MGNYLNLDLLAFLPVGVVKGESPLNLLGGQDRRSAEGVQPLKDKKDATLKINAKRLS